MNENMKRGLVPVWQECVKENHPHPPVCHLFDQVGLVVINSSLIKKGSGDGEKDDDD